jgi:hypothetical protein
MSASFFVCGFVAIMLDRAARRALYWAHLSCLCIKRLDVVQTHVRAGPFWGAHTNQLLGILIVSYFVSTSNE